MPNWCSNRLKITGDEIALKAFLAHAGTNLDFNKWEPSPEDSVNPSGADWYFDHWGTNWNVDAKFFYENGCIECGFDTASSPPSPIVELMSKKFPMLKFQLSYSIEFMWDEAVWEYIDGNAELIDRVIGWFHMTKGDEPIHHYCSFFDDQDPKVKELISIKVLFRPETAKCSREFAHRCPPESLGVPCQLTLAYTLNERIYLNACIDRGINAAIRGGKVFTDCAACLCECPISLSNSEVDWLRAIQVTDDYRDEKRKHLHMLYEIADSRNEHPVNREELRLLLGCPDLTDQRKAEIEEAMKRPKWVKDWPQWRDVMISRHPNPSEEIRAELESAE